MQENEKDYYLEKLFKSIILPKEAHDIIERYGVKIKYGPFSPIEQENIDNCVMDFLERENRTVDDLNNSLLMGQMNTFPLEDLIKDIIDKIPFRIYRQIHTYLVYHKHPYVKNRFKGKEHDSKLLSCVEKWGNCYRRLEEEFEVHAYFIRYRHYKLVGIEYNKNWYKLFRSGQIPSNSKEIEDLAKEYGTKPDYIRKRLREYLNGKSFKMLEDKLNVIEFSLMILKSNFFIDLEVDIEHFMRMLIVASKAFETNEDKDDINKDDSQDKKNMKEVNEGSGIDLKEKIEKGDFLERECDDKFKSKNENKEVIDMYSFKTIDDFDLLVDDVKIYLDKLKKSQDWNIEVLPQDVFWNLIKSHFGIDLNSAKSKFKQFSGEYSWTTYLDVFNTVEKVAIKYVGETRREKMVAMGNKKSKFHIYKKNKGVMRDG